MQDDIHQGQEDSNSPSNGQHQAGIDEDLGQCATLDCSTQSFLVDYMSIALAVCAT